MKVHRRVIEIDESKCDGCGLCITDCPEGALKIIDGKARVVNESFCDGIGACIGACPTGALTIIEREAESFDEEAVNAHMAAQKTATHNAGKSPAGTGNAPRPKMFGGWLGDQAAHNQAAPAPVEHGQPQGGHEPAPAASELRQWPIQLRLLPPTGPIYVNSDMLLLADCVAVAYPDLHHGLLAGKTIVMTCPKLDDNQEAIAKLSQIFKNPLRSLTIAIIEVPCCNGLVQIASEAAKLAGASFPIEVVRIGMRGAIIERIRL